MTKVRLGNLCLAAAVAGVILCAVLMRALSAGEDVSDVLTKEAYEFIKERGMYGYAWVILHW